VVVLPTNCSTTDGTKFETLSSALTVGEPARTEERRLWQRAAELMIAAGEKGHGIEDATKRAVPRGRMKSLRPFSVDKRLKLLHLGLHHRILRNDMGTESNKGLHHRGLLPRRQLENFAFVDKP
jgi:hypothetical protein